ncbi:MAG TPA: hypothetical protein VMF58_10520 [Rhizomicrobium sp.]|nr:hypothetical protein [Rhizomicrobium sp.]
MDIHRPKAPVHGWRELLKEIGIIVIGVVIALAAEQAVEAIHWAYQVDAGEGTLKVAYIREVDNMALRKAQSDCIAHRLSFLSQTVERAADSGRLPAMPPIGHPAYSAWTIGAWAALVASDTVSHMPREKMLAYVQVTQRTVVLSGMSDREDDQWTILDSMVGPGRRLSDVEAEQLRMTLAQAAESNFLMQRIVDRLWEQVKATGLVEPSEFGNAMKRAILGKKTAAICTPITLPPLTARN